MTRTYPAYMTVIWCMVVALVVGFGGYDVGRRLGAHAVRQEAIRAGCASVTPRPVRDMIDSSRIVYSARFEWITPDMTLAPYRDDLDRFYRRFPEFAGRMTHAMTQHK